jgi:hypothetical protein
MLLKIALVSIGAIAIGTTKRIIARSLQIARDYKIRFAEGLPGTTG